jgi:hypothetical protein
MLRRPRILERLMIQNAWVTTESPDTGHGRPVPTSFSSPDDYRRPDRKAIDPERVAVIGSHAARILINVSRGQELLAGSGLLKLSPAATC